MEYYSANRNEMLSFATTRMDLESVMLSEVSQTEKDKHIRFHLCEESEDNLRTARGEGFEAR